MKCLRCDGLLVSDEVPGPYEQFAASRCLNCGDVQYVEPETGAARFNTEGFIVMNRWVPKKMLQVAIPEELHAKLKALAKNNGVKMNEYVAELITEACKDQVPELTGTGGRHA